MKQNSPVSIVPLGQRQLCLDDDDIDWMENLTWKMHQPAKKGAVIRPDLSQGISSHQIRAAPLWDPNERIFKILTLGRPDDLEFNASSYFESQDGLNRAKLALNQIEYRETTENNYLSVDQEGVPMDLENYSLAPTLAVYDLDTDDPLARFKGATYIGGLQRNRFQSELVFLCQMPAAGRCCITQLLFLAVMSIIEAMIWLRGHYLS